MSTFQILGLQKSGTILGYLFEVEATYEAQADLEIMAILLPHPTQYRDIKLRHHGRFDRLLF